MDAINVKDLSVERSGSKIIDRISFAVPEGSFTLLSGPSGCGKTTVLWAIQGLLAHERGAIVKGKIQVDGLIVKSMDENVVAASGFLMQNVDAQIINQIIEDEVVFNLENRGEDPGIMREALNRWRPFIEVPLVARVADLSGGQKQRVLLASCLCANHRVILLDEPFANLDAEGVESLLWALKALCEQGASVLCVEHRLEVASRIADQLLWMEDGALTEIHGNKAIREYAHEKVSLVDCTLLWNNDCGAALLNVSALDARHGDCSVISQLDILLAQNSTTLLLGRNGCGKTTLMQALCGLARIRDVSFNEYRYDGLRIKTSRSYRRLRNMMGYVFQNPSFQLFMRTVQEELSVRNKNEKTIHEIMHAFDIERLANRHPYSLSQGEKRLVSVATTVATGAKLVLLDEPTIGQDYASLQRMVSTLHAIQQRYGIAYLIATHDTLAVNAFGGKAINLN